MNLIILIGLALSVVILFIFLYKRVKRHYAIKNDPIRNSLTHRDDLDMDVVEGIISQLKSQYPNVKEVAFLGDTIDQMPKEKQDAALSDLRTIAIEKCRLFEKGRCGNCGKLMPGFKKLEELEKAAEGWGYIDNGMWMEWECKECEEEMKNGLPRQIKIPEITE